MATRKRKKRKQVNYVFLGVLAVAVVVLIIGVILVLGFGRKNGSTHESKVVETKVAYLYNKATDITVKRADGSAVLNVGNAANNTSFLQYRVKLVETGDILYESPMLAPGETLDTVVMKLPESLQAGVYDVKIYLDNYEDKTSNESKQGVIQAVKLTVE